MCHLFPSVFWEDKGYKRWAKVYLFGVLLISNIEANQAAESQEIDWAGQHTFSLMADKDHQGFDRGTIFGIDP
jgi:hypothetical protein